jgi:hypothetical protein
MLDANALHDVLRQTPSRSAEILTRVSLDEWTLPELASRYGVPETSAATLLLRAARDFRAVAEGTRTPAPPLPDAAEAALATHLAQALQQASEQVPPEVRAHWDDLHALRVAREELRRRLEEAEAAAARAPSRMYESWLRRLAIAAILALSAWLYWRDRHAAPPAPTPRSALPLPR